MATLAWIAIALHAELTDRDLDNELALYGNIIYGLTWFDDEGKFHSELLQREPDFHSWPNDAWVIGSITESNKHLAPVQPRFSIGDFRFLKSEVINQGKSVYRNGIDSNGVMYRLYALPLYTDDNDIDPIAMAIVVANRKPGAAAHSQFKWRIIATTALLGLTGLFVGVGLTLWSLRPSIAAFAQRERFLTATAHELTTPLAALRSVTESAMHGDEDLDCALPRLNTLIYDASNTVENLLVFARLDAGQSLNVEPTRLDLLIENQLPEHSNIEFDACMTIVAVDPRLAAVAVRNLIDNARRHGSSDDSGIKIVVANSSVTVTDVGVGFPEHVLSRAIRDFDVLPTIGGNGLGLSLTRLIAILHGGSLVLDNPVTGGARSCLKFASVDD